MGLWLTESFFVQNYHSDIFLKKFARAREQSERQPNFSSRVAG